MDLFILLNAHLHFTMRRYFSAQKFSHLQPPQAVQTYIHLLILRCKTLVGECPKPL